MLTASQLVEVLAAPVAVVKLLPQLCPPLIQIGAMACRLGHHLRWTDTSVALPSVGSQYTPQGTGSPEKETLEKETLESDDLASTAYGIHSHPPQPRTLRTLHTEPKYFMC